MNATDFCSPKEVDQCKGRSRSDLHSKLTEMVFLGVRDGRQVQCYTFQNMNGNLVAAVAKVVADPRATKLPRNENKLKLSRYNENARGARDQCWIDFYENSDSHTLLNFSPQDIIAFIPLQKWQTSDVIVQINFFPPKSTFSTVSPAPVS